jgi:hypothetical protein
MNAMFSRHLPAGNVVVTKGGHDWRTWARLWKTILA